VKQSNSVRANMVAYNSIHSQTHIFNFNLPVLFLKRSCVDHWGLHVNPATSYFPPIRFNDQKTKIPALQRSDEFSFGFETIYNRDMPRTETVAKLTEKNRTNTHRTSIVPEINYKRFREGAALHLFLIFTRVVIKINGLISDRCRSFFSIIKWYLLNAICRAL